MQQHATITEATFISDANMRATARSRGRPLHRVLVSFSAAYFTGAFVTDLVYWQMPDVVWERFSIWLITAGLAIAGLAVVVYVIELAGIRRIDAPVWPRGVGYSLAVFLSLINPFVSAR